MTYCERGEIIRAQSCIKKNFTHRRFYIVSVENKFSKLFVNSLCCCFWPGEHYETRRLYGRFSCLYNNQAPAYTAFSFSLLLKFTQPREWSNVFVYTFYFFYFERTKTIFLSLYTRVILYNMQNIILLHDILSFSN